MKSPNKQQLVAFKNLLEREGLEVKLRESRGGKIKAACGQLVSEHNKKGRVAPMSIPQSKSSTRSVPSKKAEQRATPNNPNEKKNNFKNKKTRRTPY